VTSEAGSWAPRAREGEHEASRPHDELSNEASPRTAEVVVGLAGDVAVG
jgi:hypothetical protein